MANKKDTIPYTYLIGWPEHNLWYYGVRYANGCSPSDLWNPYTTSSKHVAAATEKFGIPTIRIVRKTFNDVNSARLWESKVLKRMNVVKDPRWLNKHDSMSPPVNPLGNLSMRKPELREKARLNNLGKNNPMFNKTQKKIICEHCDKEIGVNTYKLWHGKNCFVVNPEKREEITKSRKNNPNYHHDISIKVCEWCKKSITVPNYFRWHGNKCNHNPNPTERKHLPKKDCEYCGTKIDLGNYVKYHGKNCKNNLPDKVENTGDSVYNKS